MRLLDPGRRDEWAVRIEYTRMRGAPEVHRKMCEEDARNAFDTSRRLDHVIRVDLLSRPDVLQTDAPQVVEPWTTVESAHGGAS